MLFWDNHITTSGHAGTSIHTVELSFLNFIAVSIDSSTVCAGSVISDDLIRQSVTGHSGIL